MDTKRVSGYIKNNDITKYGLKLKIGTEKDSYIKQQPDLKPYVELYVNGKKVKELDVINGNAEYLSLIHI